MQLQAWMVTPFDIEAGMSAYSQMENLRLSPEVMEAVKDAVGDRGRVMEWHFVVVPELSFLGETYFSLLADPESLQLAGDAFFAFIDGDWDFAGPIMKSGCGVLVAPLIVERNDLSLGRFLHGEGFEWAGDVPGGWDRFTLCRRQPDQHGRGPRFWGGPG